MDPLTQTLLGAAAAQAIFSRKLGRSAALFGAVGGELPDIDVLVPWADPALPMEYHRHFTHALTLAPLVGAIAAGPFLLAARWRRDWKLVVAAAIVGCATHGLIDTCTSYGTYLVWPFSHRRLAWDLISIIDPLFTAALLIGVLWTLVARSARPARIGLALGLLYLGAGLVQRERAEAAQAHLAAFRNDRIARGRVMPTLGNLLIWRSVYESDGMLHADAVRAPVWGAAAVRHGAAVPVARREDLPPAVAGSRRVRRVLTGFWHFADGYVAHHAGDPTVFADMRYSLAAEGFVPLWGVKIDPAGGEPTVRWVYLATDRNGAVRDLWRDLYHPAGYLPLGDQPPAAALTPYPPRSSGPPGGRSEAPFPAPARSSGVGQPGTYRRG
ncbi:MAG: metal-dependent hydrolase [Planctomycetota bacterium]|jgi:inner membrane protein